MLAQPADAMNATIHSSTLTPARRPRVPTRPRGLRHHLALALAAVCLICLTAGSGVAYAGVSSHVQATQELAVLLAPHAAHRTAEVSSPRMTVVPARRPITGAQTTLPVLSRSISADGTRWLLVMLPGRPDGSTGWIVQQGTRPSVTNLSIVVQLGARRVNVYSNGHLARSFRAVVGKPSTPTPTGQFFVEEALTMSPGEPGGPFALALSARSNALQEFEGGPGQIAIHGTENLGGTLGTAASHGCIRLGTAAIDWIAARIGAGIPVAIEAH
jgi:lipoprotein-anchoring transpeptidase ErfK/SrfK